MTKAVSFVGNCEIPAFVLVFNNLVSWMRMKFSVSFQMAGKTILCGIGRQVYGVVLMVVCHTFIVMPIGIPLMFLTRLRTEGVVESHSLILSVRYFFITI